MKSINFFVIALLLSLPGTHLIAQTDSALLTEQQTNAWFQKKEWLGGLPLQPHESVNKVMFARQYQLHKDYWDKAFLFLKDHDLQTLAVGKYLIDSDNVYAMITENPTKDYDSTKWESHYNYTDLHYVIGGEEKIAVSPVTKLTVTAPYDATKDLVNYSGEGIFYIAAPGTFFLFFPSDGHRPAITAGGNKTDKKIVIKIRYAE